MRGERTEPDIPRPGSRGIRGVAVYVLIVGAVWLGWRIVLQPFVQRAPVELAVRLAPNSPLVLRRAAEAELAAGRSDNAAALGRDALARAPFDVGALRVVGLTEARAGRDDSADQLLTLAGNWSLRDDPAHAWLVEHRLRQGDYASAFAHADTLARRRRDIQPQIFRLFTLAGIEDPQRSLPVTADLIAANPPWRRSYLNSLDESPEALQVRISLAVLLEASRNPLSNVELQHLYRVLLSKRQVSAIRAVRNELKRPPIGVVVTNGDFADSSAPEPFQWRLTQKAGVVAEIVADDVIPSNPALRVDYDGYAKAVIVEQLIFLPPGSHQFTARARVETGDPAARLAWTLTCVVGERAIASIPAGPTAAAPGAWVPLSNRLESPDDCPAQWLRLETRADDHRSPTVVWFDGISIAPVR